MTNAQTMTQTAETMTVRMAGIGETWTLPNVPSSLAPLVRDLDESGILCYGSTYSRQAAEAVRDASRFLGWGDHEAAERYLYKAWMHTARGAEVARCPSCGNWVACNC